MMKKLATFALIFAITIAGTANAETINPKEEVIFDKGVCIEVQAMDNCTYQYTSILTTGIEWLDKELLLNSGLFKNKPSSNKSFAELKAQLKQQYENFSVIDDNGKEIKQPKRWFSCVEESDCVEIASESSRTEFIKQNGNTVIFVIYSTSTTATGHFGEERREIHFDLKNKKRTHLQGWRRAAYTASGWEKLSKEELNQ